MPRSFAPLVLESEIIKSFNRKENGEGLEGSAIRQGQQRCNSRMEMMGLTNTRPRLPIGNQSSNTKVKVGSAREAYEITKKKNSGCGNLWDHATITGERGVLG
eukprot:CAMPEP_0196571876 /NCGR_PEP_ID=MMETSP1081-20130531/2015_1 /TAXON_ID=36882 /ORGANISM="Pyramimonas amylifera, Strain CCMP720" /LENGTH=102 /DNA_ID=CAMNT_0041889003 /DNA_START=253 /DNA_END=561 /DNA_ORIENTATION=-